VNDGYLWWLILVGAVITLAVVWVVAARLPRSESDVGAEERSAEAAWISETIERFGGVAPPELVEEVLELHAEYLASPRLARIPDRADGVVANDVAVTVASAPIPPVMGQPEQPPIGSPSALAARTVSGPPLPVGPPPPPLGPVDRPPPRPR
jgi:hypothetical protein